jgi:PP-loop superfamily ATP-utilizing enzyme
LDGLASIELGRDEIAKMLDGNNYGKTVEKLKSFGFEKVALDPKGYRTGSVS